MLGGAIGYMVLPEVQGGTRLSMTVTYESPTASDGVPSGPMANSVSASNDRPDTYLAWQS